MASNLRVDTILPSTGLTLGIGTASGTINFLGNSNIVTTGNVSIGGTLTYEDVTNVDSIGIITARDGLRVTGIATISGNVHVGTTDASTIGTVNKNLVVGSTTNNDEVGLTLNVMEGVNGRRVKFFLDDDDGVFGVDSTASSGVPPFVVRMAASEKLRIDSNGHVLPGANNAQDLGSTAKGWRNVYMNDLNLSNMKGDTNDVDGTQGSWTIQEGKDDLYIINRLNGKKFKIKMEEIS